MLSQKQFELSCELFGSKFCAELLNTQGSSGADWLAHSVQARGKGDQTIQPKLDSVEQSFFAESKAANKAIESKFAAKFFGCLETETTSQKSHLKPDDFFGWQNHETKEKSRVDVVNHMFLKG